MGWKTISLRKEIYDKLAEIKRPEQTFSDIVELLVGEIDVELFVKEVVQEMKEEEDIEENTSLDEDLDDIIDAVGELRE